jgi:hypothetical protein
MILEEHGEPPEEGGKELLTAHDGKDLSLDERLGDGFGESRTRPSIGALADRGGGPEEFVSWPDR